MCKYTADTVSVVGYGGRVRGGVQVYACTTSCHRVTAVKGYAVQIKTVFEVDVTNVKTVSCVIRESNPGLYRGRVLFYH